MSATVLESPNPHVPITRREYRLGLLMIALAVLWMTLVSFALLSRTALAAGIAYDLNRSGVNIKHPTGGTMTCGASAAKITCPIGTKSIWAFPPNGAAACYLGGGNNGGTDDVSSTTDPSVCSAGCQLSSYPIAASELWCLCPGGNQTWIVQCML